MRDQHQTGPSVEALEARIDAETMAELHALDLRPGVPLAIVDCDEVILTFSADLARWLEPRGYRMTLTDYRLEGAVTREGEDAPIGFDDTLGLIDRYFRERSGEQPPVEGAVESLTALAEAGAQIVVLTNAPRFARENRIVCLGSLGLDAPVVFNAGGKGAAILWLLRQVDAPAVFVDDSPGQLDSAAADAPDVQRFHFVGAEGVAALLDTTGEAHRRVESWAEAHDLMTRALGLAGR